jgi:hypothetical protein
MYAERVSIHRGPTPILIIAPHAAPGDDVNTDIIADNLANILKCNAVINRGWHRGDKYDYSKEQADCNNVGHMIDVVRDEFLQAVLKLRAEILRKSPVVHAFFIHGMAAQKGIDVVIGYGAGSPNSFSCEPWRKNLLYKLLENEKIDVCVGKAGGSYSGWTKFNMNQYFRKHVYDPKVQSMQLEISRDMRNDVGVSELTAEYLAAALKDYVNYSHFNNVLSPREF